MTTFFSRQCLFRNPVYTTVEDYRTPGDFHGRAVLQVNKIIQGSLVNNFCDKVVVRT